MNCIAFLTLLKNNRSFLIIFKLQLIVKFFFGLIRDVREVFNISEAANLEHFPIILVLFGVRCEKFLNFRVVSQQLPKVILVESAQCTLILAPY
jgi:hypothetical protein